MHRSKSLTSTSTAAQVLLVLSDPHDPELSAKLRFAAAAITVEKRHNLATWLQGGLFTHLLAILRALPTLYLSSREAAETCAATAAVLCNIIHVGMQHASSLPLSITASTMVSDLCALDVLGLIVEFGMLGPGALQPLQSGHNVHLESVTEDIPCSTGPCSSGFWTPLRVCCCLLDFAVLRESSVNPGGEYTPAVLTRVQDVLKPLVNVDTFRHLMESALEHTRGMDL
jgi:hypothetical protein